MHIHEHEDLRPLLIAIVLVLDKPRILQEACISILLCGGYGGGVAVMVAMAVMVVAAVMVAVTVMVAVMAAAAV